MVILYYGVIKAHTHSTREAVILKVVQGRAICAPFFCVFKTAFSQEGGLGAIRTMDRWVVSS